LGGQFGDLSESLLKRGCNTKDSAGLIPVMGGFYDLVDSFLLASPALAAWLLIAHA
jgi:phosphatidate cytidylyltransferase